MNRDQEQLRLLAIFHYVVAGVVCLFALFPLIYMALGSVFIYAARHSPPQGQPPPEIIGWVFVVIAGVFILLGLSMAGLIFACGRCLTKRKNFTFIQIVAGVECLFVPFGTVLGVFTFIVLSRDSVRALFGMVPGGQPRQEGRSSV